MFILLGGSFVSGGHEQWLDMKWKLNSYDDCFLNSFIALIVNTNYHQNRKLSVSRKFLPIKQSCPVSFSNFLAEPCNLAENQAQINTIRANLAKHFRVGNKKFIRFPLSVKVVHHLPEAN